MLNAITSKSVILGALGQNWVFQPFSKYSLACFFKVYSTFKYIAFRSCMFILLIGQIIYNILKFSGMYDLLLPFSIAQRVIELVSFNIYFVSVD